MSKKNINEREKNRGYRLERFNYDMSPEFAAEFMKDCIIKEVRQNRANSFIESKPNDVELISLFNELPEYKSEYIHDVIDGIELELDHPSMLIERVSDKKHFIVTINPSFSWWPVFEVIYENDNEDRR